MRFGSIDLFYLLKELKLLENLRLEKIQQLSRGGIRLRFSSGKDLIIHLPDRIYLSDRKYRIEKMTVPFLLQAKKHLKGKILKSIEQKDLERALVFSFGEFALITELFSHGNLVLTRGNKVIGALRYEKWKDREIRRGKEYVFPKSDFKLLDFQEKDLLARINDSHPLAAQLARLGLGGKYAEEALASGLPPAKAVRDLFERKPDPVVCLIRGEKEAFPFFPRTGKDRVKQGSFSQAIEAADTMEEKPEQDRKKKRIMEMQASKLREFKSLEEECRMIGDYIYSNYAKIKEILSSKREELSAKKEVLKVKGNKVRVRL